MSDLFYGVWAVIGIGIILRVVAAITVAMWEWFDDVVLDRVYLWWEKRGRR